MYLYDLGKPKAEELSDDYQRQIAGEKNLNVARIEISEGEFTESHTHNSDERIVVLSGKLVVTSPIHHVVVKPNQMLLVPAGLEHSSTALEQTIILDIRRRLRKRT